MSANKGDHLRLGLFVLAGTLLLITGLYLLGSKRNLFRSTVQLSAYFHQVGGLRPGNNVRYAGINVGTVEEITIESDTAVLVVMAIREQDAAHILDNAIASLGSDGLMGNKLVNIGPGTGQGAPISDGTLLKSSVPLDTDLMMRTLDRTNVNMAAITDDLREISDRINRPGTLVYLLTDTLLANSLRASLDELQGAATHARGATAEVEAIMNDVRAGKGALGTLVSDPTAEQQVRDWLATMQQLADSLAHASAQVDRFTAALNAPGSVGYTLSQDTAAAADVRRTLDQLQKSSVLLEQDLKALQSNWFFRGYFKDQEKAAKKAAKQGP
jgi:phospholipid/cholesterol/gamma-HCH transport system substrate-binding protein